ncbi:UDP-glucose 4-epimerase GalE [Candidatus Synechococcus calcipolaris G9]|uniref:UDP-glucose 4-epimerase n=1 Tax=Candidatus Synechococcus calcipolaris G9 TaxID=1497997 RepID=A0ABT6F257_9SYNE|nr:UDP-glucose 4-epimerase GalE [Candidatus Synechococcus calcipolaris]MDG2991938.1 UDP-glucose 4-epimerase GalE [Candidatus Synechococcus calcipolaris G9]
MNTPLILVAGGAGYIGSHVVLALQEAGFGVVILDNLEHGHRELVEGVLGAKLVVGDTRDRALLKDLFSQFPIQAVMHFAAYINVGESVSQPDRYYSNNVSGSLNLLQAMVEAQVDCFVFSSTAAVYGIPCQVPIPETHPREPINPYGMSKLMVEHILEDMERAYGLRSVSFRYFNAAGADPQGRLGEDHHPETHLIPLVLQTALGQRPHITVFGTDYDTPDGTCIRDYIHVCDLAQAHVLGLRYLLDGGPSEVFNLGNGNGFSVREVLDTALKVTQKEINIIDGDRRPGDPDILVGSSAKAQKELDWQPQYSQLDQIIQDAWVWHQHRHG